MSPAPALPCAEERPVTIPGSIGEYGGPVVRPVSGRLVTTPEVSMEAKDREPIPLTVTPVSRAQYFAS